MYRSILQSLPMEGLGKALRRCTGAPLHLAPLAPLGPRGAKSSNKNTISKFGFLGRPFWALLGPSLCLFSASSECCLQLSASRTMRC